MKFPVYKRLDFLKQIDANTCLCNVIIYWLLEEIFYIYSTFIIVDTVSRASEKDRGLVDVTFGHYSTHTLKARVRDQFRDQFQTCYSDYLNTYMYLYKDRYASLSTLLINWKVL